MKEERDWVKGGGVKEKSEVKGKKGCWGGKGVKSEKYCEGREGGRKRPRCCIYPSLLLLMASKSTIAI